MNKDLGWKVFAVFIAFLLWLYVTSSENPMITYDINNVPVNFKNESLIQQAGLVILDKKNEVVTLRVRGRRNDVLALNSSSMMAQVDLSTFKGKGLNVFHFNVYGLPSSVQLLNIYPSTLKLYLDTFIRERMKVQVRVVGTPRQGFVYATPQINPNEIFVKGPESLVRSINTVNVQLNLNNKNDNVNASLPIQLLDKNGKEVKNVEYSPRVIDVTVPIYRKKDVPVNALFSGNLANNLKLLSTKVDPPYVTIAARDNILNKINSLNTMPLDLSKFNKSGQVTATIDIPEGVILVNDENKVTVSLNIQKIVRRDIVKKDIAVRSSDNTKGTVSTSQVSITIEGLENDINSLKDTDVIPYVDITGLKTGKQQVPIKVDLPENIKLIKINPQNTEVNVQ